MKSKIENLHVRYILLLALVLFRGIGASGEEERPYTGKVFLGLDAQPVELPKDSPYGPGYGMKINRVSVGSTVAKAGLQVGDIIVSVGGKQWKNRRVDLNEAFGKTGKRRRPGDTVEVVALRPGDRSSDGATSPIRISAVLVPYPGTAPEEPDTPDNASLRPDLEGREPLYKRLCWGIISEAGFEADCRDLLARLADSERYPDAHWLSVCRFVHRDPFQLETITREIADPLSRRWKGRFADAGFFLDVAEGVLLEFGRAGSLRAGHSSDRARAQVMFHEGDLRAHLDFVESVLNVAADMQRAAFEHFSEEEIAFIHEKRNALFDSFLQYKMLSSDADQGRQADCAKLLRIAAKVNYKPLVEQTRTLSLLIAPAFIDSLADACRNSGGDLSDPVVATRSTSHGKILIAGTCRDRHARDDCAVLYDLGGDDVYANNQAGSFGETLPSAVIVDYAGDDAYETHEPCRQACGHMGVGLLVDLEGNDSYVGTRFTQGAGFMGVGILMDKDGNDVYRGIAMHQGVGHWGIGVLADYGGADRYESHSVAQGVGLPGGCGLLWDRGDGKDVYYCKGYQRSGYGSRGVFEGWGQGVGMGYRPYASGGVGILFDGGGSDLFEAGNFSQGGGYFYGFGVLFGAGKHSDRYIGSRYAQGFGCHQAAGVLIDEGGNDRYTTRYAVAQGLAWDESVALFIDEKGDDRYEGGAFSQGASAMNGWALFLDRGGKDTYLYTDQARSGGNSYHGGTSLSFFADTGGGKDAYPQRENNSILTRGTGSIFADLPSSVERIFRKDAWRSLLRNEKRE